MSSETVSAATLARDLVYRSCLRLDEGDYEGFLALCDPAFRYVVRTYSPEIRREMTWLDHDKASFELLFRNLPKHNSDHAPLTRHVTVYTVDVDPAVAQATAVSALQVFRTSLDGGATSLFAVGKLRDVVAVTGEEARLVARTVRLDTRMLGIGSHVPF
jgi:methanesulfonate monooxygenase small subunit